MSEQRCDRCRWWKRDADGLASGLCRRHAPAPLLVPLPEGTPSPTRVALVEPKRDASDGCGEHCPLPRGNVDAERAALEREVAELRRETLRLREALAGRGGIG